MLWLRSNWCWVALNVFAGSVLTLILSWGSRDWEAINCFDPSLESGKWAIRLLLICLAMTPLKTYSGWSGAIKLRKPAGLWSFGFAVVHMLYFVSEARLSWLGWPMPPFIALGLLGLLILAALAVTSNRPAMRRLRKQWKRLHRLVYLAGPTVLLHAMLATTASKKIFVHDPQAMHELRLYLALLVVLLVVRLPLVRRVLRHRRKADRPVTVVTLPDGMPEIRPKVNGRVAGISADNLLTEVHPEEDVERLPDPLRNGWA